MINHNSSQNNKEILFRYMNLETEKINETEEAKEQSFISPDGDSDNIKDEIKVEEDIQEGEDAEESEEEEEIIDLDHITEENYKETESDYVMDKVNINLNNINIKKMPKEEILNILLSDKLTIYSHSKKASTATNNNNISHKKTSMLFKEKVPRQKNYFMYTNENANLINNFDSAYNKVRESFNKMVEKMNKDSGADNELYRLLLFNNEEESKKVDAPSRKEISKKVDFYLNKKNKSIETINDKVNEEFNKNYTFKPQTNLFKQNPRKLKEFISDQNDHIKKIKNKIENIKEEIESKAINNVNPQIDEKSAQIFQKKIKKENEPVYLRLYNKKKVLKKENKKKPLKCKDLDEKSRLREMYMEVFKRKNKLKEIGKKLREEELKDQTQTHVTSNKILLKRFVKLYRTEVEKLKNICLDIGPVNNQNETEAKNSVDHKVNDNMNIPIQIPENKITLEQLNSFLIRMSFISKEKHYATEEERMLNLNESILRQKEKKLVNEIYETLKDSDNLIDKEDLYYFLLSVLNLYETFLLKLHKSKVIENESEKSKTESKSKNLKESQKKEKERLKEEKKRTKLKLINEEIVSKVRTTKKYGGFDDQNKFIISLQLNELINKEFNLLYINYSNNAFFNQKEINIEGKSKLKCAMKFKPEINRNSELLSANFRRKIQSEFENDIPDKLKSTLLLFPTSCTNDKKFVKGHNKIYIESLLIKKKKQEKSMAKLKEDNELKELQSCSFKPKINNTLCSQSSESKEARFETLFKLGTSHEKKRKDKTLKERENETFNQEICTFTPKLEKHQMKEQRNEFYSVEAVIEFKQRLKKGRSERKIKESVHSRYGFKNQIDKNKDNSSEISDKKKKKLKDKTFTTNESSVEKIDSYEEMRDSQERGSDNIILGDQIPLLIIDVNIKPGLKKKIYVFDGDTADNLANKFAKDYYLDNETKFKLKILIESHMSKLLMRIDEENHSISSEV